MSKNVLIKLPMLFALMMLSGCSQEPDTATTGVVAKIGEKVITLEHLQGAIEYANSTGKNMNAAHYQVVLNRMIDNEITLREGNKRNLNITGKYIEGIRKIEIRAEQEKYNLMNTLLLEQVAQSVTITPAELEEYYQQSKNRFLTTSLHLRRIIVDSKEQISAAEKKIKAGQDFSKVAGKVTVDPELKKNNGELGVLLMSEVPRDIRAVAFSLKKDGEVSKPFLTKNKWNMLQLVRKKTGVTRPFEDIKQNLEAELRKNKAVPELKRILERHKQELNVEIYNSVLAQLTEQRAKK
jgi:parvulin-like peptidyl-prolyl isomerase